MTHRQQYYKKKALLATLRHIERRKNQMDYFRRNIYQTVGLGALLSLSIPGQGLGNFEFKGPSILEIMNMSYWELAFSIAFFYGMGCIIGHFVWKWQDILYLKELQERKDQLMRELGFI